MQKQFTHDGATYTACTNETTDPVEVAIFDGHNDKVHSLTASHETLGDMRQAGQAPGESMEDLVDYLIEDFKQRDVPLFDCDDDENE